MILKSLKWGFIGLSSAAVIGGLLFGRDLTSYLTCTANNVRETVKDSVPIEFELERARGMIEEILPELRANIRVIAQEEVEVAHLRSEIEAVSEKVSNQRELVSSMRDRLQTQTVSYQVGSREMSRDQIVQRLSTQLDRYKQGKVELESKQRLLETRERSLGAACEMLEKTQARKSELEQKIEALVAKHRLVQAQAAASNIHIDNSQLARADRLMTSIEKRLQTAERVLAREAEFVSDDLLDPVSESELLAEVDEQLGTNYELLAAENDPQDIQ